ncbi:alpha/beta hydrolase [Coraliomargarita sp. W4R72]
MFSKKIKLIGLAVCLLGCVGSTAVATEFFDWGRGVEGREGFAAGDSIDGLKLLNGLGGWQKLAKSQTPVLGGTAGAGGGWAVFPDSSVGKVRNSGMQLALEPVSVDSSVEFEVRFGEVRENVRGLDGLYFGLFDDSAEKNLLVNKEKDRIWFRINPLGLATLYFSAGDENHIEKVSAVFPTTETVNFKFKISRGQIELEYLEHGRYRKLIALGSRNRPHLNALAFNAVGISSLNLNSISWSGIVPRQEFAAAEKELHLVVPTYLQQNYIYREVAGQAYQLEVFMPTTRSESLRPAILFLHGGSWKSGNRTAFYDQCRELAEMGMITISTDYRTRSRDGVEPIEAVRDAKEAMRWVKSNAHFLGIDPKRIAAGGGSAGGQLALSLALETSIDVAKPRAISTRPDALVLFNPVLDTGPDGFANHLVEGYWQDFSPYHQLKSGLPPMLIMIGDLDGVSPPEMVRAFASRARSLGNEVEVEMYPGKKHGFFNRGYSDDGYDLTISRAKEFLRSHRFLD